MLVGVIYSAHDAVRALLPNSAVVGLVFLPTVFMSLVCAVCVGNRVPKCCAVCVTLSVVTFSSTL